MIGALDIHPLHSHIRLMRDALLEIYDPGQLYRVIMLIYDATGVVVHGSHSDDWHPDVKLIASPDRNGDTLVLIPYDLVQEVLDDDQMEGVWAGMEADAQLLRQAHG